MVPSDEGQPAAAASAAAAVAAVAAVPAADESDDAVARIGSASAFLVSRPNLDSYTNFSVLDVSNVATRAGVIGSIAYFAQRAGSVRFFLTDAMGRVKHLSDEVRVEKAGRGSVTLPPGSAWKVKVADCLGLFQGHTSCIAFSFSSDQQIDYTSCGVGAGVVAPGRVMPREGAVGDSIPSVQTFARTK